MQKPRSDEIKRAEDAQAALRDGIERAREIVCEAKLALRQQDEAKAEPPLSAQ